MKYADFAPTGLDPKGLGLEDRQDWIVAPCQINRDSGSLDRANWQAMLASFEAEEVEHEVHRFGHWACGWFEIVIVDPAHASKVEDLEGALANYPVLCDETLSRMEHDDEIAAWDAGGCSDWIRKVVQAHGLDMGGHVRAYLDDQEPADLLELFHECGGEVDHNDEGASFHGDVPSRDRLAAFIWEKLRST